jgi:hypothetical protein
MKTDQQLITDTQAGLLGLLNPGATLRFSYIREGGKLSLEIAGTENGSVSATLAERLQVVLETLRSEGLVFGAASETGNKVSAPIA